MLVSECRRIARMFTNNMKIPVQQPRELQGTRWAHFFQGNLRKLLFAFGGFFLQFQLKKLMNIPGESYTIKALPENNHHHRITKTMEKKMWDEKERERERKRENYKKRLMKETNSDFWETKKKKKVSPSAARCALYKHETTWSSGGYVKLFSTQNIYGMVIELIPREQSKEELPPRQHVT